MFARTTTIQLHHNFKQLQLQHYNFNAINYKTTTTTTATTTTTTPQQFNYTTITMHFATPHYILQLWLRRPLQPLQKSRPPFGPSVDSLCPPCITAAHLSYSFLSLKFPPPPCAVLLVTCYLRRGLGRLGVQPQNGKGIVSLTTQGVLIRKSVVSISRRENTKDCMT